MKSRSGGQSASKVAWLHALGFDRSVAIPFQGHRVKCSQCEVLVINGVPCHESGCPNETFECKGCSNPVSRRGAYCEDCR